MILYQISLKVCLQLSRVSGVKSAMFTAQIDIYFLYLSLEFENAETLLVSEVSMLLEHR